MGNANGSASANPTLLFAALQEFFESGSRSANAEKSNIDRRLSENKNLHRSKYDELFTWAPDEEEEEERQENDANDE